MKIGIVLAGGMSKGAYEIGCLQAISEHFRKDEIRCICASSIGALVGYAYAGDQLDAFLQAYKEVDSRETGRFFPALSGNADLNEKIRDMVLEDHGGIPPTFITVWNYSRRKVEYIPFHKLSKREAQDYLRAAIAIPIFNKGVKVNGCTMLDGAFLDNIPVYPMLQMELDYIFCIYFDCQNYLFENEAFDAKVIKLNRFPTEKRWDSFTYDSTRVDDMVAYGYEYAREIIRACFSEDEKVEINRRIRTLQFGSDAKTKRRLTCDVILANLNKMGSRLAKREIR